MIRFELQNFSQEDWQTAVASFCNNNLMQDYAYGEAKARMEGCQVERGSLIDDTGSLVGVAQTMLRALPVIGGGLAWINRGPLWQRPGVGYRAADFAGVLRALRRHYADDRGYYLRIAPLVLDQKAEALSVDGFLSTATSGWASANLELAPDAGDLRAALRQNWRNGLNKAERSGIHVVAGTDDTIFDAFLSEYADFTRSRGIVTTVTPELLRALQRALPKERRMTCYRGFHDGIPLGSVLIVRYGETAEYLAGTLLDAGRAFNVGQFLLWHAIQEARTAGLRRFDLGGMDPESTPKGVYDFKRGVSGEPYQLVPEIEARHPGVRARLVRWRVRRARGEPTRLTAVS